MNWIAASQLYLWIFFVILAAKSSMFTKNYGNTTNANTKLRRIPYSLTISYI